MVYPNFIHSASKYYNDALILVEINDVGEQVGGLLYHDLENENVLFCIPSGRNGQQLDDGGTYGSRPGLKTTTATKGLGCANLKTLIEDDKLLVYDNDIINELGTFIAKGKGYEADTGCNDDLAMCLVLFGWLVSQPYFKELTDLDTRARVVEDRHEMLMEELAPFGFFDDGTGPDIHVDDEGQSWLIEAQQDDNDDPFDSDYGTTNMYA